jgi:glycosyltransferase involved in cell wall biosynthesis
VERSHVIRVMYFSDAPYFGGAERYLELLISGLTRATYEPCVLTIKGARLQYFRERLAGMGVATLEISLGGPYDVMGYIGLARVVRNWKPDLLHINLPGTYNAQASLVAPVARLAGCRSIVTTEHLAMIEGLWKRHLAKRLSGLFIGAAISITQSNVEFLTRVHRVPLSRIVMIHNGVNIAELDNSTSSHVRSALGIDASVFVFAAVGSLIERKGLRFLLAAFAKLCLAGLGQTALLIVGEGEEEVPLKGKCSELGLAGKVFFLGHREDVQSIIRDIDCLVVPSTMEGMPFVILEAMVASKPVIASKIYGIPEVIVEGETGFLVPARDVDSLYTAMRRAIENPALSRQMGAAGRRRAEAHFSHEQMVREVERVYEAVLSGGPLAAPR